MADALTVAAAGLGELGALRGQACRRRSFQEIVTDPGHARCRSGRRSLAVPVATTCDGLGGAAFGGTGLTMGAGVGGTVEAASLPQLAQPLRFPVPGWGRRGDWLRRRGGEADLLSQFDLHGGRFEHQNLYAPSSSTSHRSARRGTARLLRPDLLGAIHPHCLQAPQRPERRG